MVRMGVAAARVPELVPVLSRGKHRNPRKGACFMELASFVAGERWSDHPACTHRLLASLARHVNDATSDAGRSRLAPLVPDVIGLTSDDPLLDVRIALRSAAAALPVAAAERQRAMAVAVIVANRLLADEPADDLGSESRWALANVPDAGAWAEQFSARFPTTVDAFRRHGAPRIVGTAVEGIADACVPDPDRLLYDLLRSTIVDCRRWIRCHRVDASAPPPAPRIRDRSRLPRWS
jgi:hypothetical protein